MTRREIIAQLEAEYAELRRKNEAAQQQRTEEVFRADPEILRLRTENASLAVQAMRRIMADRTAAKAVGEEMKRRGIENNRQIRQRLTAMGKPEDYLEIQYSCPKCQDTGYIGDANPRMCECFEKQLMQRMFSDSGIDGAGRERFETFDEKFVPNEPIEGKKYTQRFLAKKICQMAEQYANSYPNTAKPNMVLMGNSGLGKTFLINAMAARLIERGFAPLKVTAHRLFEAMRRQHFGAMEGDDSLRQYIDAPVLLIDDLGSEPLMKNITVEYLYLLLNERFAARRHTVIATNLMPDELKARYFERVASRILDRQLGDVFLLEGKDLRIR